MMFIPRMAFAVRRLIELGLQSQLPVFATKELLAGLVAIPAIKAAVIGAGLAVKAEERLLVAVKNKPRGRFWGF